MPRKAKSPVAQNIETSAPLADAPVTVDAQPEVPADAPALTPEQEKALAYARDLEAAYPSFCARIELLKKHRLAETSADMQKVLGHTRRDSPFTFTIHVNLAIEKWGINTDKVFAVDRNPKAIKRFIQFVHAVNANDYKAVDVTTCCIIYALHLTGGSALNIDALHYLGAGLASGKVNPETKGVNQTAVRKLFGKVGLSTIPTQASRTVGANGFLQLVGATVGEPGKTNQQVTLNAKHPMIEAFFASMNKATDKQTDEAFGLSS